MWDYFVKMPLAALVALILIELQYNAGLDIKYETSQKEAGISKKLFY
jgi:hypothetical protein